MGLSWWLSARETIFGTIRIYTIKVTYKNIYKY